VKEMFQNVRRDCEHILPHDQRRSDQTWKKSIKRCFKWSNGSLNTFSDSWPEHFATWIKSINRCLKCSHDTLNSFSAPWLGQNATWLKLRKRFARARMALWYSFQPLVHPKMRLVLGREAMCEVVARNWELIFCLLTSLKCDLVKV